MVPPRASVLVAMFLGAVVWTPRDVTSNLFRLRDSDSINTGVENPTPQDITFLLYNSYTDTREVRIGDESSMRASGLKPDHTLFVVVHDWAGLCPNEYNYYYYWDALQKALLKYKKVKGQVLSVDWSKFGHLDYRENIRHVPFVGHQLGAMLTDLQNTVGLRPGNVHILGIGAGAHIAGYAGQDFPGIDRITGLDPLGKLMHGLPAEKRLSPDDAGFVDVIHTADASMGYPSPMGTVDIFANGGKNQWGCTPQFLGILADVATAYDCRENCHHNRAVSYFITSMSTTYLTFRCDNYLKYLKGECLQHTAKFGFNVERSARGKYYIANSRANRRDLAYPILVSLDAAGGQGDGALSLVLYYNGNSMETIPLLLDSKGYLDKPTNFTSVFGTVPYHKFENFTYGLKFRGRNMFTNRFRVNSVTISAPLKSPPIYSCRSVVVKSGRVTKLRMRKRRC